MTVEYGTPASSETALHELQGKVAGVAVKRQVEFMGEKFAIADKVGLMPLMRFAHASSQDLDTSDMEALAAVYDMLRDCIDPGTPPCGSCAYCKDPNGSCPGFRKGDWKRFEEHATQMKADADDLLPVVQRVIEILTARPTEEPSGSSPGPSQTSGNSTATYSELQVMASGS